MKDVPSMRVTKVTPFIPQYKKDPNHVNHKYSWHTVEYRGYMFYERRVTYQRLKQKDTKTEVIQVIHLGSRDEFESTLMA